MATCRERDESGFLVDEVKEPGNWFLKEMESGRPESSPTTFIKVQEEPDSVSGKLTYHE